MCCIAGDDHLGPAPSPRRRAEEQRPPLDLGRLVENCKDHRVEVTVELEHPRLINCGVPVCS